MTEAAPTAKVLTFFVGDEQFAVTASDVIEIHRLPRLTRVPNGPASLLGIGSLRGLPAPVVSLARLLGKPEKPSPHARLLQIDGDQSVGLAVDRVGTLTAMPAAPIEAAGRKAGFGRLFQIDDQSVRALDLDSLLRAEFATHARRETRQEARMAVEIAGPSDEVLRAELSFLAFDLAGQGYALPIEEIEEVLALPEALAGLAQSDQAVLGVTTLRDRLLPVVSLRLLLGLPQRAGKTASDRVVVARIGEARIGLAVDRLRSILRVKESSIDPAPAILNRGEGQAQVRSICRLEKGGLVAILSAERLFRDEKVAHILADGKDQERKDGGATPGITEDGMAERFLIFRLGTEEYGLPLDAVDEVVRLPAQITRLPNAPDFVAGIVTLRGKVIPVIDQRLRFAAEPGAAGLRPRIVVTSIEGRPAGFIVDTAAEILAIGESALNATPQLAAEAGRLFSRVASLEHGKRLILLIEPKELLERAERDLLARLTAAMDDRPA